MDHERGVRDLLRLALDELRKHNESYHNHTPEEVLDLLEQALKTTSEKTLGAIYRDCIELLERRRNGVGNDGRSG